MKFIGLLLFVFVVLPIFAAYSDTDAINMNHERTKLLLLKHRMHMQHLSAAGLASPKISDIGNIAVIKGNKKTFFPRNPFDLTGRKISFVPNATGGYNVKTSSGTISGAEGDNLGPAPIHARKVNFGSGFSFPFYGITYTSIFVTGSGCLAFGSGCEGFILPDLLAGPPMIFPYDALFAEQVKILQTPDRFTITWRTEAGYRIDTQVSLFKNGTIEFLYAERKFADTSLDYGLTGISPGNTTTSNVKLVNFSVGAPVQGKTKTAFFEEFRPILQVDPVALLQEFHKTHKQVFDFVTIFTDQPSESHYGGGRFFALIQNSIRGIGIDQYNNSESFGSSQIQGFIMMNSLADLHDDPDAVLENSYNTLQLMGYLHGSRWMPYVRVMSDGVKKYDLLGIFDFFGYETYFTGLWNFFLDTDASVMGGNDIRDNGNGTFTTVSCTQRFSKLDQYLMGLIPSKAVPRFFYTGTKPLIPFSDEPGSGSLPRPGVSFGGSKVEVTIDQVIQANGERNPSSKTSQKQFREAFIYFIRPGSNRNQSDIKKIDKIRSSWQTFFDTATDHNGTMLTTLK